MWSSGMSRHNRWFSRGVRGQKGAMLDMLLGQHKEQREEDEEEQEEQKRKRKKKRKKNQGD